MGTIANQFSTAFRDFVTDGVSSSGAHDVIKEEVRAIGPLVEAALGLVSLASVGVVKQTRALLNADLAHAANTIALVYGDATDANNDLYVKVGGSGSGSWTLTTIIHDVLEGAGKPWADLAEMEADRAQDAANFAEEFGGINYAETAAGVAATAVGSFFRVWNGDTPRTYARYERIAGSPFFALASPLATTQDLAATASNKGLELLGFLQSGTGALPATARSKARQILSAADFTGFDSTGITSSTSAIAAAITEAAARGRCDVMIPTGAKTGALTLPGDVGLIGPSSKAVLTAEAGNYTTITLNGSDTVIENLTILEAAKSGGATFIIDCGTSGKDRNTIENVVTFNSWKLIGDSGTGNGVHTTSKLRSIQAKSHRGPGLAWSRGFAFLELDHVIVDYVGVSASNFTGFSVSGAGLPAGAGGLIVERCDVLGTMGTYTNSNQIAYNFEDLSAVRIRNTRADTCGSDGYRFARMNGIIAEDITSGLNDGHAMSFTDCVSVLMSRVFLFGRNYLTTPTANKDGLRFVSGNAGIVMGTIIARDFTGNGVHKAAAQPGAINIANCSMFSNTGHGVKTLGDSGFTLTGGQWGGNAAGNYNLGGGFDYVNGQLASGAFLTSIGPGPVTG